MENQQFPELGFVEYLTHPWANIYSCTHTALSWFLRTVRLKCLNSVLTGYLYPSCFKAPVTVQGPFLNDRVIGF